MTIEYQPPKRSRGKPFVKGDPRINRDPDKRRAKGVNMLDHLRRFLNMTPAELRKYIGSPASLATRKNIKVSEMLAALHIWSCISGGKGQREREALIERIHGKPAQPVDVSSDDAAEGVQILIPYNGKYPLDQYVTHGKAQLEEGTSKP